MAGPPRPKRCAVAALSRRASERVGGLGREAVEQVCCCLARSGCRDGLRPGAVRTQSIHAMIYVHLALRDHANEDDNDDSKEGYQGHTHTVDDARKDITDMIVASTTAKTNQVITHHINAAMTIMLSAAHHKVYVLQRNAMIVRTTLCWVMLCCTVLCRAALKQFLQHHIMSPYTLAHLSYLQRCVLLYLTVQVHVYTTAPVVAVLCQVPQRQPSDVHRRGLLGRGQRAALSHSTGRLG